MNTYINMDGVENVSVMLVKHARRDFIKGGKILYRMFGYIPDQKEFYESPKKDTRNEAIRWTYDAWRFIHNDPYSMFGDVGEEAIINQWKLDTIIDYHKDLYANGSTELYLSRDKNEKEEIYELKDSVVKKRIKNKNDREDFFKARNYILTLSDGRRILDEWNRNAYDRSRKIKRNSKSFGRISIENTDFAKKRHEQRLENIAKAKKLKAIGKSNQEISESMGLTIACIQNYLRS